MSTFLLIIKILPWVLTLGGGLFGWLSRKKAKSLKVKLKAKDVTIGQMRGIVLSQGEQLEKNAEQISELMEINKKYETKKKTIKNSKTATDSMATKRN